MKTILLFFKAIARGAGSFFKAHYGFMLFVVFLASIALWGFVFWQYGYQVVIAEPQVSIRPLSVKSAELKEIINDMDARAVFESTVMQKTFPDPFVQIPQEKKQ